MTSSIFLPRMSRAWPEPSTHLMESTMFVLPEPFGPTIAVTPPSKRISVARANVLNPNKLSERKNKGPFTVADVVGAGVSPTRSALYSIGAPNWRLRGGSGPDSLTGSESDTTTDSTGSGLGSTPSSATSATLAARVLLGLDDPRRARVRAARGGLATVDGLTAPTRLSSAARAASCSASCLVAPCPVPSGSAPAKTTDVYSRFEPTFAPSLS